MRKNLRVFYLSLILVQLLCLYGCDSDNNPTDPGENMQNPYLSVKILTPNSNSSFCTNLQDISLEGNIVSSLRVLSLKWTSTSRSSGSVEPESNWSIESIPLVPGDQTIMVEVTDVAHTTASDQIQVTFNQNLEITADLSLSPSVILTDESSVISASITAEVIDPASIEQVYLVKVNPDNVVTDTLTAMFDDGQVEHGDRYTNDNIYSGLVIVDEPVAAIISLRALFDVNASNEMIQEFSSRRKLTILDQVAESEFDQLINILNETEQLIEQNAENLTDTELIDLISSW
ncbi:hypothetical protein K8I28_17685, partial [bacterium]|nr:hypothetical protein [bacterium]